MSHYRGEIIKSKDILGDTFYKIFTGCNLLDDLYTCKTQQQAEKIALELTLKENNYYINGG